MINIHYLCAIVKLLRIIILISTDSFLDKVIFILTIYIRRLFPHQQKQPASYFAKICVLVFLEATFFIKEISRPHQIFLEKTQFYYKNTSNFPGVQKHIYTQQAHNVKTMSYGRWNEVKTLKTTSIQRRSDVVCHLGKFSRRGKTY